MSKSTPGLNAVLPDSIISELARWKQLVFHTDMQPHKPNDHQERQPPYFHPPNTLPPHLPPETYTYLIQALLSLQGSAHPHNYPPTLPYPNPPDHTFPWLTNTHFSIPSSVSLPPHLAPQSASSSQVTSFAASSSTTPIAQDPEGTEDAMSITEDKRRRNTAASARFRVKRKLKTLNLERSVAELSGRTEELEREATDLRRENAWLKEIVLLKGRNLAASSRSSSHGSRHGEDEEDETRSELGSTVKRRGKGKDKETER